MLISPQDCNYLLERRLVCRWVDLHVANEVETPPYFAINNTIKTALYPFVKDLRYREVSYFYAIGSKNNPTEKLVRPFFL